MINYFKLIPQRTLLLIGFILFMAAGLIILSFRINPQPSSPESTPTASISPSVETTFISSLVDKNQEIDNYSFLQNILFGSTLNTEQKEVLNHWTRDNLSDGNTEYTAQTQLYQRPNILISKQDQVIFKRMIIPPSKIQINEVTISKLIQQFSQPERTIIGSKTYGDAIETFIYPSQGVAFVGNRRLDQVYEIQSFEPSTLEKYLTNYGQDIEESKPVQEPVSDVNHLVQQKPWLKSLPLKNPSYFVEYNYQLNSIIVTIYPQLSFSYSKEQQVENMKKVIIKTLNGIGVNINQETIEWRIDE